MTPNEMRAWRKHAGLSQTDLGELIGLSLRQVQDIEAGKAQLRESHIMAINYASLTLAQLEGDGRYITPPALKLVVEVEKLITPAMRAFAANGEPLMSPHERILVNAWATAAGRPPSDEQVRVFL
ncbi:MAG: hypothetical protein DI570_22280, partial [Phenylobacterium zucineum]